MLLRLTRDRVGVFLMGTAGAWSIMAPWFSAHKVICVTVEFASYWFAFVIALAGGYLFAGRTATVPVGSENVLWRRLCVGFVTLVLIMFWRSSDAQFGYWKKKAMRPEAWPQIVSDLKMIGAQSVSTGTKFSVLMKHPPKALQQLGCGEDYSGGFASAFSSPEYEGVTAGILFGYKDRSWGLCVGPESLARKYSRGNSLIRVASNAYFFIGPRD
jgi:hypothetical protein